MDRVSGLSPQHIAKNTQLYTYADVEEVAN